VSVRVRLAAFAASLVVVFAAAFTAGAAFRDDGDGPAPTTTTTTTTHVPGHEPDGGGS
jgi:hypothetical protein